MNNGSIHFYIEHSDGFVFFDNEVDMFEYAKKHNTFLDECLVYDHEEMGLKEITRKDIEHGGIDYSDDCETIEQYVMRRSDAEFDYLDTIIKLREHNEYLDGECDRLSELESIIWTQLYGEEKVLDDTKRQHLSDAINKLKEGLKNENQKVCTLVAKIHGCLSPEDCKRIVEENKQLKEEIEQLNKKKSIKWSREFAMPLIEKLREENKGLKKEIKEMKNIVNECNDWVDTCRNDNGFIESYDMRAIDFRLSGGKEDSESDSDL